MSGIHQPTSIGSTSSTMTKRESTRNRKYKQIQERKIVQAELSLRWWHKHKCYQQFTPIVLQTNIPLHELEATENTMIQHHQAKLNFPYITSYMKGAFSGFTKAANNKHNGTALWAKLRQVRCTTRYGLFQTRLTVSHLCTNIASASTPFASFCNPPPPLPQYMHFTSSPTTFHGEIADKREKHYTRCFGKDGSEHRQHQNQIMFSHSCVRRSTTTFGNSYATVSLKQDTLFHRNTYQARNWCAKTIRHYSRFFTIGTKHTQRGNPTKEPRALARNCHRLFHRITSTTITLPYN